MAEEKEIGSLGVKIGLDGSSFQQGVGAINKQLAVVKSELSLATAKIIGFGSESEKQKVEADGLTKIIGLQEQKVKVLGEAFDKSVTAKGRDSKATQDLEIKLNKAKLALVEVENELKATTRQLDVQSPKVKTLGNDFETAARKIKTAGQNIVSAGQALTIGVTAPIVGVGYAAGKASISFETAFAGVRKTVNATEAEFADLRQGIRDMAMEIPVVVEEISAVETAAGQLGIAKENIEGFTGVMLKMGVATNLTSETAATQLAKVANITQMSQTDFDRLGSTIVRLGNNMATTEADIVAMDLRLAGAGHTIGLTNAQTLGLSAALSSVGIEAESGGSSYSKLMVDMASATASGGKQLNNLAAISGMTAAQFKQAFKEDAAGAIVTFTEGLGKMQASGQDVFGALEALGMTEVRMRDALLRAAGAGDLFRKALDHANAGWSENNALQKEAEQRFATSASKLQIMKNKLTDVGITLGDALVPAVISALDAAEPLFNLIKDGAEWFAALPEPAQQTALTIAGIAAAAGPATVALGFFTIGVGSLGTALAVVTGPIGLLVGGISALAVIGGTLAYKWDELGVAGRSFTKTVLDSLGPVGRMASAVIQLGDTAIDLIKNWETTRIKIAITLDNMSFKFKSIMNGLEESALNAALGIVNKLSKVGDFIPGLSGKIEGLKATLNSMGESTRLAQSTLEAAHNLKQHTYALELDTIASKKAMGAEQERIMAYAESLKAQNTLKSGATTAKAIESPLVKLEGGEDKEKKAADERRKAYAADLEMAKFKAQYFNQTNAQQIAGLQKVAAAHKQHLKEDIGDEHAYLLEVKKLREDMVKDAETKLKEANDAKFKHSKDWIATQKDFDKLSEKDELAAWKRVSAQYKAGTDEKLEADKNYYKLKKEMDERAVKEAEELAEESRDNAISAADDLGDALVKALKNRYDAEQKVRLKANQDAIDALDEVTKAEDDALKERDYNLKKSELQKKMIAAENTKSIATAQKNLNSVAKRNSAAQAEYENNVKNAKSAADLLKAKERLNSRLIGIGEDMATAQSTLDEQTSKAATDKAEIQTQLTDLTAAHERQAILNTRNIKKKALEDERRDIEDHYKTLTTEEALQAEARKLALDTNNKEMIQLLKDYNPQWQNAGQSFGESLLTGLKSTKLTIQAEVNSILALIGQAKTLEAGKNASAGLAAGVMIGAPWVKTASTALSGALVSGIVGPLQIKSPSRVMEKLGQFTGQGFANGMGGMVAKIREQARLFATAALPASSGYSGSTSSGSPQGTASQVFNAQGMFAGAIFNVRTDNDIQAIAKALFDMQQTESRGLGFG